MATGKGKNSKHPYDTSRPESPGVKKALENMDMEALGMALTHRQRRFCDEYTVDFNGTAAAIRAGYSTNYPDRQASLLLKNKGVATYIEYLTASKASKIMSVDPDWITQGIVQIITKAEGKDNDKLRGYELLAKILGMLKEKTEITGADGGPIEVQRSREEAADFTNMLKTLSKRSKEDKDKNGQ